MELNEILKSVILGIVEGITEWLPISSTGHMILVDEFLQLNTSSAFKELFLNVIQLGAILAVVVLYFHKLFPFTFRERPHVKMDILAIWSKIIIACVPGAIVEFLLGDKIDALFNNSFTVAVTLILYGILFILIENRNKNRLIRTSSVSQMTYRTALIIGLFQVLAVIPGTSRSGATILGAILIGTSRTAAAEFTFYLAIPVMFGASLLKLVKFGLSFTGTELAVLLTGTAVAFLVSIAAIQFLVGYIKKHDFKAFGWYRIILGAVVLLYFTLKTLL